MRNSKLSKIVALSIALIMSICSVNMTAIAADTDAYKYEYTNWYARSVHRYMEEGSNGYWMPAAYLLKNGSDEFAAYCVDLSVSAVKGTKYKRLNLEDVTYFKNSSDAAKVRAIVNNGFWPDDTAKTLDALRKATNKSSLTAAEALSGTQLAIWEYGNSGTVKISSYYASSRAISSASTGTYQTASGVGNNVNEHGDLNSNAYSSTTNSNIMAVRSYLLNLAPQYQSANDVIFNDNHFVSWHKLASSDGSTQNGYEVTFTFGLASTNTTGNLVLSATQNGETFYNDSLSKIPCSNNTYTLSFKTYDLNSDIKLTLKGTQSLPNSVYFYQAEEVYSSQSFVGRGSGSTDVNVAASISMKDIDVADHNYKGTVTKEPTCTEKGEMTYTCENDPTHPTYTEEIEEKGHTPVTDETVNPTCTEDGLTEGSHCSECGETLKPQEKIPAKEHEYEVVVTKEPTCTEKGEKTYTCKNDPTHTYTEEIEEKGHTPVTDEAVEPTCTEDGLTEGSHCSECGETLKPQEKIPAKEHEYEVVITKEPTCNEKGEATYTCKNDSTHTYTEEIEKKDHTLVTDGAVESTYDKTGLTEGSHCSECGEIIVEQSIIPVKVANEIETTDKQETTEKTTQSSNKTDTNSVAENDKKTTDNKSKSLKSPETGSDFDLTYAVLFSSLSVLGLIICVRLYRKRNYSKEC